MTKRSFRTYARCRAPDDAPEHYMTVPTCPLRDGGTQWVSLSAAVAKRSSAELAGGPKRIVLPSQSQSDSARRRAGWHAQSWPSSAHATCRVPGGTRPVTAILSGPLTSPDSRHAPRPESQHHQPSTTKICAKKMRSSTQRDPGRTGRREHVDCRYTSSV